MPLLQRTNLQGRRETIWAGFAVGALAGLAVSLHAQIVPRFWCGPNAVFTGFPQGLDQYTYAALAQAVWRSPTRLTYAYPYSLWWQAPPVLFHLPIALLAWIGQIASLPGAFEIMRVAGAAASGGALTVLSMRLFPVRRWACWLLVVAAAGGAWFWPVAVAYALTTAGTTGLTEIWEYLPWAMGPFYSWLPFLTQNLVYPLECFYHAFVLGSLLSLVTGRMTTAFICNVIVWTSNPFSSLALNAAVVPWLAWHSLGRSPSQARAAARKWLPLWIAVGLAAYAYHHLFLGQWEITREVARLHITPLAPPPTLLQTFCLVSPFAAALVWSVATPAGWRHVWCKPSYSLFAILALSQVALVQQGHLLGERALQPYHFNRGYLQLGLCVVLLRCLAVFTRWPRALPRWCIILLLTVLPDQALWFTRYVLAPAVAGIVQRDVAEAVARTKSIPQRRVVVSDGYMALPLIGAITHHEPFYMPESSFIPFSAERQRRLGASMARPDLAVADLGIGLALATRGGGLHTALIREGWMVDSEHGSVVVLKPPEASTP